MSEERRPKLVSSDINTFPVATSYKMLDSRILQAGCVAKDANPTEGEKASLEEKKRPDAT